MLTPTPLSGNALYLFETHFAVPHVLDAADFERADAHTLQVVTGMLLHKRMGLLVVWFLGFVFNGEGLVVVVVVGQLVALFFNSTWSWLCVCCCCC